MRQPRDSLRHALGMLSHWEPHSGTQWSLYRAYMYIIRVYMPEMGEGRVWKWVGVCIHACYLGESLYIEGGAS